jgi:predicted transport protein
MNQDQRKYLIAQVEDTCREQIEALEEQIPDKPSLNNYIIAAFLDNSIQFADIEKLKKKMRTLVLKLGSSEELVKSSDEHRYYGARNRKKDEDYADIVEIPAEDIFIIPQAYLEALAEYDKQKEGLEKKIKDLKNVEKTITLKLQIGSAATLDKLVMQVDNMGDLNLVNTQLSLEDKR